MLISATDFQRHQKIRWIDICMEERKCDETNILKNIRESVVNIKGGHFHSFKKDATFLICEIFHI